MLSTTVMRAAVVLEFGGPEVLKIMRDVEIPQPKANEILVKVAAVGVNPVDAYIRSGSYKRLPSLPYIPGNDMSGTVVSIGADVNNLRPGDRVASFMNARSGAYAEYCALDSKFVLKLPKGYDFMKGAALGVPYFTAYHALFNKENPKPRSTVLIHGASGGVGIAACQLASAHGMTVLATAGTEDGMSIASKKGANYVFNHHKNGYTDEIMKATDGKGPDFILEMLSNVNLNKDLAMIAHRGSILIIGCRGKIEINPRDLMSKECRVQGVALAHATPNEYDDAKAKIEAGLKKGWVSPHVGVTFSLNDVAQAHYDIINKTGAKGKMVLCI